MILQKKRYVYNGSMKARKMPYFAVAIAVALTATLAFSMPKHMRAVRTKRNESSSSVLHLRERDRNYELGVLIVYVDPGIKTERLEEVFDAAKSIKAKWIRIGFIWALANPEKDKYNFKDYDIIINEALKRDLRILPVVIWTPEWASANRNPDKYIFYPPTEKTVGKYGSGYDYLEKFAETISERYKGKIEYYELWNEPDMRPSLCDANGNGTSSDEYAKMLSYFYKGIKAGNKEAKVVLGGLAQGEREPECEKDYALKLLGSERYPAGKNFDVFNFHTNFKLPDEIKKQIEDNEKLLKKFGIGEKKIWITETSYTSDPKHQILEGYKHGEIGFSKYVYDAITAEINAGADVIFWAALHDYKPDVPESDPYKYSGLFDYNLHIKLAGEIFRNISEHIFLLGECGK